jgi:hypothetical protein
MSEAGLTDAYPTLYVWQVQRHFKEGEARLDVLRGATNATDWPAQTARSAPRSTSRRASPSLK